MAPGPYHGSSASGGSTRDAVDGVHADGTANRLRAVFR